MGRHQRLASGGTPAWLEAKYLLTKYGLLTIFQG